MKELLIILTLGTIIIVVILISSGIFQVKKTYSISRDTTPDTNPDTNPDVGKFPDNPEEIRKKFNIPTKDNYILPAEFQVGIVEPTKPLYMNNCNPNILYPNTGLGPWYGWVMPEDCRCTEFVQPP